MRSAPARDHVLGEGRQLGEVLLNPRGDEGALVGPFALVTLRRALRGDFSKHRQIARVTFPMWLYVVVTGWTVYWMLHNLSAEAY